MKKFLLVFVIAGLALAGCGGGSSKSDSGSSNTTPGGTSGGSSDDTDFGKLLDLDNGEAIRVTYQYGSDEDSQITVSRDGSGKLAFLRQDEQAIFDGDTAVQCENLDATPECKQYSGAQAKALKAGYTGFLSFATTIVTAVAKIPNAYGDKSTETIAGRDANCATITASAAGGIAGNLIDKIPGFSDAGYKVCADKETGILLSFQTVGLDEKDKNLIEATAVGEPKNSDFEPPVTPETVPEMTVPDITLPGGYTIPSLPTP
jgi:hypothetical protein